MPKSDEPTAAPTFDIQLGGETRTLQYGFRAFKALKLNPFQPQTLVTFLGADLSSLDVDKAAEWIRAGLLWEYAKGKPRHGETPPEVDELVDDLDLPTFLAAFQLSTESAGLTGGEKTEAESADPPADPQRA
jgi:hypothetical protein